MTLPRHRESLDSRTMDSRPICTRQKTLHTNEVAHNHARRAHHGRGFRRAAAEVARVPRTQDPATQRHLPQPHPVPRGGGATRGRRRCFGFALIRGPARGARPGRPQGVQGRHPEGGCAERRARDRGRARVPHGRGPERRPDPAVARRRGARCRLTSRRSSSAAPPPNSASRSTAAPRSTTPRFGSTCFWRSRGRRCCGGCGRRSRRWAWARCT